MGLTAGQAKQMAISNVVYPTAVVALVGTVFGYPLATGGPYEGAGAGQYSQHK